ncbi:hypothetical protein C2138_11810 [Salinibacterium hongtaonis]|nr:hypothetical protein C2138_11810 [Salinibacterium hongtaonis]
MARNIQYDELRNRPMRSAATDSKFPHLAVRFDANWRTASQLRPKTTPSLLRPCSHEAAQLPIGSMVRLSGTSHIEIAARPTAATAGR